MLLYEGKQSLVGCSMSQVEIVVGIIGAISAVLAASIPYYLSKNNEITLDKEKTKLDRYDTLLQNFVLLLQASDTDKQEECAIQFIMAYQRASSYASQKVLKAIEEYISLRAQIFRKEPGVLISEEEKQKWWKEAPIKINNVFTSIREDIYPTESHFAFKAIIQAEELGIPGKP